MSEPMVKFRKILYCPSNRSHDPQSFARVLDLARGHGATLTLFGVVPAASRLQHMLDRHANIETAQESARRELLDRLTEWTAAAHDQDLEVVVEVGHLAPTIIERVLSGGHDLVAINDVAMTHPADIKHLLRVCRCPVWTVRSSYHTGRNVLAAVHPDPDEIAMNKSILDVSVAMLETTGGGGLHVVHAWELYGDDQSHGLFFSHTPPIEPATLRVQTRAAHERALSDLLATTALPTEPHIHVEQGPPEDVILETVRRNGVDLVVMGISNRDGLAESFTGHTAEHVLTEAVCGVMVVKAPDFVSRVARAPSKPA